MRTIGTYEVGTPMLVDSMDAGGTCEETQCGGPHLFDVEVEGYEVGAAEAKTESVLARVCLDHADAIEAGDSVHLASVDLGETIELAGGCERCGGVHSDDDCDHCPSCFCLDCECAEREADYRYDERKDDRDDAEREAGR